MSKGDKTSFLNMQGCRIGNIVSGNIYQVNVGAGASNFATGNNATITVYGNKEIPDTYSSVVKPANSNFQRVISRDRTPTSPSSGLSAKLKFMFPLPVNSVHYELCEMFIDEVQQGGKKIRLLCDDSVVYIMNNEYCIGQGNFAKVYLGYHIRQEIWVAVKRYYNYDDRTMLNECKFSRDPMFRNQHSNIGCFIDIFDDEDEERVFLVMELYEESLDKYLKKHPNFETKIKLALDCLRGFEFLHEVGIVHRDIKPQNVMVNISGVAKIVDFGISKKINSNQTLNPTLTTGTTQWLPPEVVPGRMDKVTKEGDVFVAAMLLFYIFSGGEHPFCDLNENNLFQNQRDIQNRKFQTALHDPFLHEVIRKILETKDPQERPSIKQILHILDVSHGILKIDYGLQTRKLCERTHCDHRLAILVSCSELPTMPGEINKALPSAKADVVCLNRCLEECGFRVLRRDNITKVQLMSKEFANPIHEEPIADLFSEYPPRTLEGKNIFLLLHISTHGLFDRQHKDTFLEFKDGRIAVTQIIRGIRQVFNGIRGCNLKLMLTIDACRTTRSLARATSSEFPTSGVLVFYGTAKGGIGVDPGGLPGSFSVPAPFSASLSEVIKPGLILRDIIEDVGVKTKCRSFDMNIPETDENSDPSLLEFVF